MEALDVLCLGEALVDLVATTRGSLRDAPSFTRHAGGAPANVARGVARLGARAGWTWAVGDDEFGHFLLSALRGDGVDVTGAVRTREGKTGLAFIALDARGERSFVGYGQPDASRFFRLEALAEERVESARIVHVGSNTLMEDPTRAATLQALSWARGAGRTVSLDVNLRLHLWPDRDRVRAAIRQALPGVHLLKVAVEEGEFLTGLPSPLEAARALRRLGAGVVVVTLGAGGCVYASPEGEGAVPAFDVEVKDATGAGDAFVAGLLVALRPHLVDEREPAELEGAILEGALRAANAAGAAAVRTLGACEWRRADLPAL